jgi:hypothetical protein
MVAGCSFAKGCKPMFNTTQTVVAIVAVSLAVVVSRRWLTRRRVIKNRFGLSFGKHSIGFHFGKLSAYAFPASGRTLHQRFLAVK